MNLSEENRIECLNIGKIYSSWCKLGNYKNHYGKFHCSLAARIQKN